MLCFFHMDSDSFLFVVHISGTNKKFNFVLNISENHKHLITAPYIHLHNDEQKKSYCGAWRIRDTVVTFETTISKKLLSIPKLLQHQLPCHYRKKRNITKDPWPAKTVINSQHGWTTTIKLRWIPPEAIPI